MNDPFLTLTYFPPLWWAAFYIAFRIVIRSLPPDGE